MSKRVREGGVTVLVTGSVRYALTKVVGRVLSNTKVSGSMNWLANLTKLTRMYL